MTDKRIRELALIASIPLMAGLVVPERGRRRVGRSRDSRE